MMEDYYNTEHRKVQGLLPQQKNFNNSLYLVKPYIAGPVDFGWFEGVEVILTFALYCQVFEKSTRNQAIFYISMLEHMKVWCVRS